MISISLSVFFLLFFLLQTSKCRYREIIEIWKTFFPLRIFSLFLLTIQCFPNKCQSISFPCCFFFLGLKCFPAVLACVLVRLVKPVRVRLQSMLHVIFHRTLVSSVSSSQHCRLIGSKERQCKQQQAVKINIRIVSFVLKNRKTLQGFLISFL